MAHPAYSTIGHGPSLEVCNANQTILWVFVSKIANFSHLPTRHISEMKNKKKDNRMANPLTGSNLNHYCRVKKNKKNEQREFRYAVKEKYALPYWHATKPDSGLTDQTERHSPSEPSAISQTNAVRSRYFFLSHGPKIR